MKDKRRFSTYNLVLMSLLAAIVVVLQLLGSFIKFGPFSISLVLLPISIGAALVGVPAGGLLGLVFGIVVLLSGDAAPFLAVNIPATIGLVIVKGIAAGLLSGLIYKVFAKKNKTVSAVLSAAVCPVVNTGVFVIGVYLFFLPTVSSWGVSVGAADVTSYIFLMMIGVNFLIELGLNLILSPVIVRLIQYSQDRRL
ncbi:MAG: ECF transporter S component, partial [Oscillospiraceae bacterium]|nr:ECF transporter S component [Oscillospiraceae bacterium]